MARSNGPFTNPSKPSTRYSNKRKPTGSVVDAAAGLGASARFGSFAAEGVTSLMTVLSVSTMPPATFLSLIDLPKPRSRAPATYLGYQKRSFGSGPEILG